MYSVTVTVRQEKKTAAGRGDEALFRRVKAHFALQGTTYSQWAKAHGIRHSSLRLAILHGADGKRLRRLAWIRKTVLAEIGGEE